METQVDRFGRIVIPKVVREHLGLKTGSILHIEEGDHNIVLKMADHTPQIKIKGGIAVYVGQAVDDIESAIQQERDQRLKNLEDQ